ncbi:ankyrin repeat-containing protein [Botrytis cinerea]
MDIKPTKELLYAMAVVIVTIIYFAFTMAPTAKTTKVIEPTKTTKINPLPKKLKCFRIRGLPIETTKKSLEEELMRCLPTYGSDCSITLARSSSTRLMATLNSFETPNLSYTIDHDFLGVTPLFEGDESFVDIVFVPGLGSHSIGSFKGKDSIWIRDFLPKDLPSARILAYGYDTSILDKNAKHSISDLAKAFLSSVRAFRSATKASQRPLIFVAHSLGGLNNKSLAQIVAGGLNEQMIKDLQVRDEDHGPTQFLSTIKQNFKQCCKEGQFQIRSYYELRKTHMVRKLENGSLVKDGPLCYMVSESSACDIGINNNFCYEEGLVRDHSDLVKFADQSDDDYTKVLGALKGLIDGAPNIIEARFASIKKLSSAEKRHWDDLNIPP